MESRPGGLPMAKGHLSTQEKRTIQNRGEVNRIIDGLPDDILLEIFYFYVHNGLSFLENWKREIEKWQTLVHVCRRWRTLVFQSPRRLNLRLYCTSKTPAKDTLDVWPAALPLIVSETYSSSGSDNVIAALGHSNRVSQVNLHFAGPAVETVFAAMQVSFPELISLGLSTNDETLLFIPDSFLGGSAPSLRYFSLYGITFPGLPKLLLSTTHLISLSLTNIPHSFYITPEAIVALLSGLSSLDALSLGFKSPQSRPDWQSQSLPPPKRPIFPALRGLYFEGVTEYLEELVTLIDTPRLEEMRMAFFNQIDFDCPRLAQFINCTPTFRALDEARVGFHASNACVNLRYKTSRSESSSNRLEIAVSCNEPDWQVSFMEQVFNSSLPLFSTVEDLYIEPRYLELGWKVDAIESTLWLELLLPFTAVKNLYLSKEFALDIATAFHEGIITEVLPSLQNIFVEGLEASGPVPEKIGGFVAARQLSGPPIAISVWHRNR